MKRVRVRSIAGRYLLTCLMVVILSLPVLSYAGSEEVVYSGMLDYACMFDFATSTDGGCTWTASITGAIGEIDKILPDDSILGRVYTTLWYCGLLRSHDFGSTWSDTLAPSIYTSCFQDVIFDPLHHDWLWLTTDDYGVSLSTDTGATWQEEWPGWPPGSGWWIARGIGVGSSSTSPRFAYVGIEDIDHGLNYVYKRDISLPATPWVYAGLSPNGRITTIKVDPLDQDICFALCRYDGLWRTTDGGNTWVEIFVDPGYSLDWGFDYYNGILYLPVFGEGIYISTDLGETWECYNSGLNPQVSSVCVFHQDPNILYAGCQGSYGDAIYKSTNGGDTWFLRSGNIPNMRWGIHVACALGNFSPCINTNPVEVVYDFSAKGYENFSFPTEIRSSAVPFIVTDLKEQMESASETELIPVIIVMSEQLDSDALSTQLGSFPKWERRNRVTLQLKSLANRTQKQILSYLRDKKAKNIRSLWIVNAISAEVPKKMITEISSVEGVNQIFYDGKYFHTFGEQAKRRESKSSFWDAEKTKMYKEFSPSRQAAWNIELINADDVWLLGYTGQGVIVGHLDSGVNYTHNDLADHMWDGNPTYPRHGWDFVNNDDDPMDDNGHGTHTAGTVASDGTSGNEVGVAPDAQIMAIKVLNAGGNGTLGDIASGVQFAIDNGADVITMSLGAYNPGNWIKNFNRDLCNNAHSACIPMAIAAGNAGEVLVPPVCIGTPADVPAPWYGSAGHSASIAVGATDSFDIIATFSSYGPTEWHTGSWDDYPYPPGLMKPDVSAPGVDILSCDYADPTGYTINSGTSMSCPHVAGTIALMLEKAPNLLPFEIDSILEVTSVDLGAAGRDNYYGAGRIDALAAVNAAEHYYGWGTFYIVNTPAATGCLEVYDITWSASWIKDVRPKKTYSCAGISPDDSMAIYVSVDTTGLASGIYTDILWISHDDTTHQNPYPEPITLIIGDYLAGNPYITAVEKLGDNVKFTWQTLTGADHYVIYRNTDPSFVLSHADSIGTTTDTFYTDVGVINSSSSYYYLVKGATATGTKSAKSNMAYKLNKFVNENAGATGDRNWVSLPWYSEYDSVPDLTADLSPSGNPLSKITNLGDDQIVENWIYHSALGWYGDTFDISAGRGYEMIAAADDTVIFAGSNNPAGCISLCENPGAIGDRNWVSIPYNAVYDRVIDITDEYSSSGEAVIKITNLRDDQIVENWIYHSALGWYGDTLDISAGRGYEFVAVLDTIWNPTEYTNESDFDRLVVRHKSSNTKVRLGSLTKADRAPVWIVDEEVCSSEPKSEKSVKSADEHDVKVYKPVPRSVSAKKSLRLCREAGVSHVVRAEFDAELFSDLVFTAYRLNKPYDVLTEQVIGGGVAQKDELGVLWFDVGNFMRPWQDGEEVILIVEALHEHGAYYQVISFQLDQGVDIQELGRLEFELMPVPKSVVSTVVSWPASKSAQVIGYSVYQGDIRTNSEVIQAKEYSGGKDITLRLVIKGGYETVYSSGSKRTAQGSIVDLPRVHAFTVYPNPFIKKTMIDYALPKPGQVSIMVYDVTGRKVTTLVNDRVDPGYYQVHWSGCDDLGRQVSTGVYFMRMNAPGFASQQKVVFVR